MKFFFSTSSDPFYNIALEEFLLTKFTDNILLCYVNAPSIVVGRFQVPYKEVDVHEIMSNDINIVRRLSGGGTVFHDRGNLNYSFIHNAQEIEGEAYDFFNEKTVAALRILGLDDLSFERNNIFNKEKKISGVAQYKRGSRIVHHGTLLVNTNLDLLRRVFVKKDNYISKGVASVPSSVANIAQFVNADMDSALNSFFSLCDELFVGFIDRDLIDEMTSGYASEDWVYGRSPNYQFTSKAFSLYVTKGKISGGEDGDLAPLNGLFHSHKSLSSIVRNDFPSLELTTLF